MRKRVTGYLPTIVLAGLILVLTLQSVPIVSAPSPLLFFTNNIAATTASPTPTEMEEALLGLIHDATTSIDTAIYDFNRDSIRDALLAAHARGVSVRVVTDDEVRHETASYVPYYKELEEAGIPIFDDQRPGSIMHNKFFIVDGRYVWTGSTNVSDNGFTLNHNNALLLDSLTLAALYQEEFEQMFVEGNFSNAKQPGEIGMTDYYGIPMELYFSPRDNALAEIVAEVQSATESITFAIFYLTADALRDALIERAQAGIEVRGVWDLLGASNPFSDDESLCAAGIPIKVETFAGKMHNKFMVIDAYGANPRVVTGSMNWSASGNERNDENSLIIHDLAVSQAYRGEFDALYAALPPETECETGGPVYQYITQFPIVLAETALAPPTAEVHLVSITYNPPGDDVGGEHVVIENRGSAPQTMTGWTLIDEAGWTYTFPVFNLEPGTRVAFWVKSGVDTDTDLYWGRNAPVWNNNGDTAMLADTAGQEIDVCNYEGGGEMALCD